MQIGRRALVLLGWCFAALPGPAWAQAPQLPQFKAVLAWHEGHLVVDAVKSELDLGAYADVYAACGLTPQVVHNELVIHLAGVYRGFGPAFERLVIPPVESDEAKKKRERVEPAFRALVGSDAETRAMLTLSADWPQARQKLLAWWQRHKDRADPPVAMGEPEAATLYKAAEFHAALADGPLLPLRTAAERDQPPPGQRFSRGEIIFRLAPPLVDTQRRLRPVANVAQWDALRQGLADEALKPLRCKLWQRQRIIDNVQEYLELRGLAVQPYRVRRDASDRTGLDDPPPQPPPQHSAGIGPERTRFPGGPVRLPTAAMPAKEELSYGGRVLLLPDPLVQTVFVETGARGQAALWPALYLLLPSSDFAAVRTAPQRYLCRTSTVWKPAIEGVPAAEAARLDLDTADGRALRFARLFMTPPELAPRLQRLAAIGYKAAVNSTEDVLHDDAAGGKQRPRVTKLVVEPLADIPAAPAAPAAATQSSALPPAIPACAGAPPVSQSSAPLADPSRTDAVQVVPATATATATATTLAKPRAKGRDEPQRNELLFSVEKPSGKPLALGLGYSRQGLQPGERFSIGFGQQRKGSVQAGYSSDFVGFDTFGRRVQLAANAFSTQQAERPQGSGAPGDERLDERREGAALRTTVDLWRDLRGSFGQAELGVTRTRTTPEGSRQALPEVTLAELTLIVAHDERASHAAPHSEALLTLGHGRSAGRGFGKAGIEFGHQRFIGAFERLDLRLRAAAVGAAAPAAELVPFGGEDSVRGYRSDWALARRAASLQTEAWLRLPVAPASEGIARALRRNVALALFADIGTLTPAPHTGRRTAVGAGLGLRYTQGAAATRLTLKLDLARALPVDGALPRDERKTRLHFSVSTQHAL